MTFNDVKWFFGLTFDYWLGFALAAGTMAALLALGFTLPLLFPVGTLGLSAVALSCLSVATIAAISTVVYALFRFVAFIMEAQKNHPDYFMFPYFRAAAFGFALVPAAWVLGMLFLPIAWFAPLTLLPGVTLFVFFGMPLVFPALWLLYQGARTIKGHIHWHWCQVMTARLNSDHLTIQARPRTMRLLWWFGAFPLPKLKKAIQADDQATIDWFLDRGAQADHRLLAVAASLGNEVMVGHLLDRGVPVRPDQWQWGRQPSHALLEALKGGHQTTVDRLVKAGATLDPNTTLGPITRTPLLLKALLAKHDYMVTWLKDQGANLDVYHTDREEPRYKPTFDLAMAGGHYEVARLVYHLEKSWWREGGKRLEASALLHAAQAGDGDDQLFLQLCEDGSASVLQVDGQRLIVWAVVPDDDPHFEARLTLARKIIEHDQTYYVDEAILAAVRGNCLAFIKLFIELKPDHINNRHAGELLAVAAKRRFPKLTLLLLEACGVNVRDPAPAALILDMLSDDHRHLKAGIDDGSIGANTTIGPLTVLTWAVLWGAFDVALQLVSDAADVNAREGGRTVVEWAVAHADLQLLQLLMFAGAQKVWTPELCQPEAVNRLLQHGWDVSQSDQKEQPQTGQDVLNAEQWGDHADALAHLDHVRQTRKRDVVVLPAGSYMGGRRTEIQCTFFRVHHPDGGCLVDFPEEVSRRMYVVWLTLCKGVTSTGPKGVTNITDLPSELLERIVIWVFYACCEHKNDGAWRPQCKPMERLAITEPPAAAPAPDA